jgi:hypothetical protein
LYFFPSTQAQVLAPAAGEPRRSKTTVEGQGDVEPFASPQQGEITSRTGTAQSIAQRIGRHQSR